MNRRDRERYLTHDQANKLQPLLLAAVARVALRMSQTRTTYKGSKRDNEVLCQAAQAFRMDMNEQICRIIPECTWKYIP